MFKPSLLLSALPFVALGPVQREAPPDLRLKEERMTLEYTATAGEAVVVFQAESEAPLSAVSVLAPGGGRVLGMNADAEREVALSGFVVESRESSADALLFHYPEGIYDLRARTTDGRFAVGRARLSHDLLAAPEIVYPYEGAKDVPANDLIVTWLPDPKAAGYRVVLEQGDSDTMHVDLPGDVNSLTVPHGVLARGTPTHVEVGALGRNGNCTIVEVGFTTR